MPTGIFASIGDSMLVTAKLRRCSKESSKNLMLLYPKVDFLRSIYGFKKLH